MKMASNPQLIAEFKALLDAATSQLNAQMPIGFQQVNERLDRMTAENKQMKEDIDVLRNDLAVKERNILAQSKEIERLRRHSYAYDVLLHGVPEQNKEDSKSLALKVSSFLTARGHGNVLSEMEHYAHRLGPSKPRHLSSTDVTTSRPRPIVFRMLSRATQFCLVTSLSKSTARKGEPYLSNHFTPTQILEFKQKHRSGLKRPQSPDDLQGAKEPRASQENMEA